MNDVLNIAAGATRAWGTFAMHRSFTPALCPKVELIWIKLINLARTHPDQGKATTMWRVATNMSGTEGASTLGHERMTSRIEEGNQHGGNRQHPTNA